MKVQKWITLALLACVLILTAIVVPTYLNYRQSIYRFATESVEINSARSAITQKEQQITNMDTSEADALEQQEDTLQKKISATVNATTAAGEKAVELTGKIAEKQTEFEELNTNAEYYDQVWAALQEGYQRVLGYLNDN